MQTFKKFILLLLMMSLFGNVFARKVYTPKVSAQSAYAYDVWSRKPVYSKNAYKSRSIASITKLMMAMIVLDSKVNMNSYIRISSKDVDHLKWTSSRLKVGRKYKRKDLLLLALMSSENRASHALARTTYKSGTSYFIKQMNAKAKRMGLKHTHFADPTGLNPRNKSTAAELAVIARYAYQYSTIKKYSTTKAADFKLARKYYHHYINTDRLVRFSKEAIKLSKTGFINEAGECIVIYTYINHRPYVIVVLKSKTVSSRFSDAQKIINYVRKLKH